MTRSGSCGVQRGSTGCILGQGAFTAIGGRQEAAATLLPSPQRSRHPPHPIERLGVADVEEVLDIEDEEL